MSTERIDHAATAVAANQEAMKSSGGRSTRFHRKAQVHATLALVEEQRTANLIAYVQLLESQYAEAAKHPDDFQWETHPDSLERHTAALAQIRKGLGL